MFVPVAVYRFLQVDRNSYVNYQIILEFYDVSLLVSKICDLSLTRPVRRLSLILR